jgi:multimeric flavodoxin WrbA
MGPARETGAKVDVKRVPETVPAEIAKAHHFKLEQAAPIAKVDDLANYDTVIIGAGTRFGRISPQMAAFLDQAGSLWMRGALMEKWAAHSARRARSMAARAGNRFPLSADYELTRSMAKARLRLSRQPP